jgi:plastocyanin
VVRNRITAAFLATVTLGLGGVDRAVSAAPAIHTVIVEATRFEPDILTVRRGDVVRWINKDPFPHTVTALGSGFDSKIIAPNKSWRYTPRKKGVFAYFCTLHPTMKATLRVQ